MFAATNAALGPVVVLIEFGSSIVKDLGATSHVTLTLYAVYFLAGSTIGLGLRAAIMKCELRSLLIAGATVSAVGQFLAAQANDIFVFAGAFATLVCTGGSTPIMSPLAIYTTKILRSSMSLAIAVATVGQLTSFGVWHATFRAFGVANWRDGFVLAGAAGLVCAALCWPLLPPRKKTELSGRPPGRRETAGSPVVIAACFGMITCSGTCIIAVLPALTSGLGPGSQLTLVFSLAALVGRLSAAALFDLKPGATTVAAPLVLMTLGGLFGIVGSGSDWLGFTVFASGLGYGGAPPVLMAQALRCSVFPERTSVTAFQYGSCGLVVGAGTAAFTSPVSSPPTLLIVSLLTSALALLLLVASLTLFRKPHI